MQGFRDLQWGDKKFYKRLAVLALPIIAQELVNSSVNILDSFMVGTLGLSSINGVGFANQIFFLFTLVLFGMNGGGSMFMGQYWGRNDVKSIHKVMGVSASSAMVVALLFFAGAMFIPEFLIGLYSNEADVIAEGVIYLRIVSFSYFCTAFSTGVNASLRSIGQTKIPMFTTMIALGCNALFNYLCIFVFKWGVAGAALATVTARVIELIAQIVIVRVHRIPIGTKLRNYFSFDQAFVKNFFKFVSPIIINEFVWALGTTIYNIAYKGVGNEAQGAVQISGAIQNLFMVFGMAVGTACGIMMTNALGANEFEYAKRGGRKCMLIGVGLAAIMGGMLIVCSPLILGVYDVADHVKEMARMNLVVIAGAMLFKTYNYTTICGILRSGGDTKFCLIMDIGGVWLVGVPLAFIGSYLLDVPIYVVVAMVHLEEVFKFIISTRRVFSNVWVRNIVAVDSKEG